MTSVRKHFSRAALGTVLVVSCPLGFAAEPIRKVEMTIESPGERLRAEAGRLLPPLADLILNSTSYAKAKAIAEDPRLRALPALEQKALHTQWKAVQDERSRLLSEARLLDRESKRLFRKGKKIEKAAARWHRKRDDLNRSIDLWSRDCADEQRRCQRRRASLEKRARCLERGIGGHNAGVAEWRDAAAGLERRAGWPESAAALSPN